MLEKKTVKKTYRFFKSLKSEVNNKNSEISIFNLFLLILLFLRSAGYFEPYFPISINFVVLVSAILAILIFNLNSRIIFILLIISLIFAVFLKLVRVDIWAERTMVYSFQFFILGTILFMWENRK